MAGRNSAGRRGRGPAVSAAVGLTLVLAACGGLGGDVGVAPDDAPSRTSALTSAPTGSPSTPTPPAPASSSTTSPPSTRPPVTPSRPPVTPTTSPTPDASPSPSSSSSSSPPSPSTAPPTPTEAPRTTLILGDRGPAVLELQERLSGLGYWLGTPDGVFGGLTQQAVFALQKAAGIGRDGVVGPRTKAALEAGARPGSRVGGTGVEIDLDRQLLLIVRDGAVTRILNTSTGNGEEYVSSGTTKIARTPTGRFAVFRQVDALEVAELGELYRPKYFYRGYAVHGSPSVPPYPASHGCARVTNAAIAMIWDRGYLEIGTPVTVY